MRALILLALAGAVAFLVSPFVLTSRQREARGIKITGRVSHKSEYVAVLSSGWKRSREVTVEYPVPESGGVSFFNIHPDERHYDALHFNQAMDLRYLLRRDIPDFPLTDALWQMHALPTIRPADPQGEARFTPGVIAACVFFGGLVSVFILWRITRWSPFAWIAGIGFLAGVGFLSIQDFPRATRAPSVGVRHASARVSQLERIDKLFSGSRQRGIAAEQPVDVVGIEFVPEGRTEPVVAVDLIDHGSIAGLKVESTVAVRYEVSSPRIAQIEGVRRTFPQRNALGAVLQGVMVLGVLIGLLAASWWIGRAYRRLTAP